MARMTADDFVTLARIGLGGETSETLSDNVILRLVNQSLLEICAQYDLSRSEESVNVTTSDGTAEYTIAKDDVLRIRRVIDDTNGLQLEEIDRWLYEEYTQGTTSQTGQPFYWFESGIDTSSSDRPQITLYVTPDDTYTVRVIYTEKPPELVQSPTATSPYIQEVWDDSILHRAIARGWRLLGDPDNAAKFMAQAQQNDAAALKVSVRASEIPVRYGSIAGWQGARF